MDGITIDEASHLPPGNTMQQHFHQKLGKPTEFGQKTPSRGGLGMVINESKTPGAKSIQKMISSTRKNVINVAPVSSGFEIFEDQPEELDQSESVAEQFRAKTGVPKEQLSRPGSPFEVEKANRCSSFDSFAADIADDMLDWNRDEEVILSEDQPISDFIESETLEADAAAELAALGIEAWDEYPPIEIASRLPMPDRPINEDDFPCDDAVLEEDLENYPSLFANYKSNVDPELINEVMDRVFGMVDDMEEMEDLLGEEFRTTFV